MERAYLRLQAGQPPDEAIEQQWQQLLKEEQLRKEAQTGRKVRIQDVRHVRNHGIYSL